MNNRHTLAVALAFAAGCGGAQVAQVAQHWVVPPAYAGLPVQRWQYVCPQAPEDITATANEFGQQGWEMVAATPDVVWGSQTLHPARWCFKRPAP
jgi:hypothetical protein